MKSKIKELKKENKILKSNIEQRNEEIKLMRESKSWKLTKPLRLINEYLYKR